ncbi:MAG: DUF302 domain-containing protein [Pseudomonadota bacterium]
MIRTSLIAAALLAGCATAATNSASATAAASTTEASEEAAETMMKAEGPSLVSTVSANDFATTLAKLRAGVDARGFKTFAVVDHKAGAKTVGQELRPTTLVIFGNPKGGTPLMQSAQTLGIALPLKALVYENEDGEVIVATTDIVRTLHEHGVKDREPLAARVAGALNAIASEAAAAE